MTTFRRVQHHLRGFVLGLLILVGCDMSAANNQRQATPELKIRVVNVFPHDTNAFTQGLEVEGETLFESTGLRGSSDLRRVDLRSGKVELSTKLQDKYFGEGITILNDRVYLLTWQERTCIVYDKESFKYIEHFFYEGEGWGLANDGMHLFMTDGTSWIYVRDPATFKTIRKLRVTDGRRGIVNLNELEYFDGHVYANVWKEDRIAKIDPESGDVVAWVDCRDVYPASARLNAESVLNGIAHDAATKRTFITGKKWPQVYEIEILDGNSGSRVGESDLSSP